jgi:uncharacterized protein (DUF2147 family)
MIKRIQIILLSLAMILAQTIAIAASPSPVGLWKTIDDVTGQARSLMRITESNGVLYGTIVKIFPESGHYQNGVCDYCVGPYHNKPLEGVTVMRGLKAEANNPGNWSGGKITDPKNGKTYRCAIEVTNGGKSLNVRGYIGIQLLGRTQVWQRASK